jgi:hypothetical protein
MGGAVVVVGAVEVLVAAGWDAAVEVSPWPPQAATSRAQTTATAKRAAERLVLAGMRRPPPALQRGEDRVSRGVV